MASKANTTKDVTTTGMTPALILAGTEVELLSVMDDDRVYVRINSGRQRGARVVLPIACCLALVAAEAA